MSTTDYILVSLFAAVLLVIGIGNIVLNGFGVLSVGALAGGSLVAAAVAFVRWRTWTVEHRSR